MSTSLVSVKRLGIDISAQGIWRQGFKVQPVQTSDDLGPLHLNTKSSAFFITNILVVNSPQLLMSFLYLLFNNILTRQLVADEWIRFLRDDGKKPLRVTSPVGMQRSSYTLSLPMKYSIPLMGLTISLHWLISQSLFLVQASSFSGGANGQRLPVFDFTARGYSILGSWASLSLGFLLVGGFLAHSGWRSYRDIPPGFQLMGFNSSAIQATCQRPEDDVDAYLFPVSLGIIGKQGAERLLFSTHVNLVRPMPGESYLLPSIIKSPPPTKWRTMPERAYRYTMSMLTNIWCYLKLPMALYKAAKEG